MHVMYFKRLQTKLLPCLLLVGILCGLTAGICTAVYSNIAATAAVPSEQLRTIVLDAGHGGEDGGTASAAGVLEKDVNLAITLRLKALLQAAGFTVKMVRDTDVAVNDDGLGTLAQRKVSDIKNRLKLLKSTPNSIFVSIHQNHFPQTQYHGTQVFYSSNHPQSEQLAQAIQTAVVTHLQTENTRQIKPSGSSIYLLKHAQTPAVLVECGFLSNPEEAARLTDSIYQGQMAFSVFCGILRYLQTAG